MAGYLLLRDNKESGPYSLDDLVKLGLKAYDLVWVQGKSAAWRYPSEIGELKAIAPVIEEQPFDRFYKKSDDTKVGESAQSSVTQQGSVQGNQPNETNENNRYAPSPRVEPASASVPTPSKKSIFVTLPGQNTAREVSVSQAESRRADVPGPRPSPSAKAAPEEVAEIKYSQPLDEIKERYVRTLLDRKDKKSRQLHLLGSLKKVAAIVILLGFGLAAGLYFRAGTDDEQKTTGDVLQQGVVINPAAQASVPSATEVIQKEILDRNVPVEKIQQDDEPPVVTAKKIKEAVKINEEQEPTTVRIRKETMLIVPKEKKNDFPTRSPQFSRQAVETDPITGERNARVRNADDLGFADKTLIKSLKSSLHDQVSVSSNDYKRVAFGGIRNLYLTVTNHSKYELDNVIVELQYLKPSEELLRTENIRFRSVAPNGTSTVRVPDTNRGIKVNYKIINIDSKQGDGVALKF